MKTIVTMGQESPIKGLRIIDFEVDPNNIGSAFWLNENGTRSFRYSFKELEMNKWVELDRRNVENERE